MDEINLTKYTAAQLGAWSQQLNLPTEGTKNPLVLRLNEVPENQRGVCPIEGNSEAANTDSTSDDDYQEAYSHTNEDTKSGYKNEFELLKKELELIKREKELLEKENEFYRKIVDFEKLIKNLKIVLESKAKDKDNESGGSNSKDIKNDEGVSCEVKSINDGEENDSDTEENYGDGEDSGETRNNDSSGDKKSKAKKKVQRWLCSIYDSLDRLLDEMFTPFGEESKLNIRWKFVSRTWQYNEEFRSYFNNKVMLAERSGIPEEEILDYIIDGIPDNNLRAYANLFGFRNKTQILMTFSRKPLKKPLAYNCLGHYISEWRRPASTEYLVGDYVMVKNSDSHVEGPYRVEMVLENDTYMLKNIQSILQPRYPRVWAAKDMHPWPTEWPVDDSTRGQVIWSDWMD